jgi:proteasome accessory factor B
MYCLGGEDRQRVVTVSRKSERLVNLTIALLATKRWLTKSEIFATIDGYEGDIQAKERMFERDKDELRKLGIAIEVGSFDPLFEDEAGYRIRPDDYTLQIGDLSAQEFALISLATKAWRGAALNQSALTALVKLQALGLESDLDGLPDISSVILGSNGAISVAISAISERRTLTFEYLSNEEIAQERDISPYGVATQGGLWYLAGLDNEKGEDRLFRIDRIVGDLKVKGKGASYQIPDGFSMHQLLNNEAGNQRAVVKVRLGKAHALVSKAIVLEESDEWLRISYPYFSQEQLIQELLWHLDDVELLEPVSARSAMVESLTNLIDSHHE